MQSLTPDFELHILETGRYNRIVGIDEVGRGCWAGPTTVGAYFFTKDYELVNPIQDSKLLTEDQRNLSYPKLITHQNEILFGTLETINKKGIGKTIEELIYSIVQKHRDGKTLFLIDGQHAANFGVDSLKVLKGDSMYYSIAAASIVAKVERDELMKNLHEDYPMYGFNRHKGYATKQHREAIEEYGICELHRTSFKPIQRFL